MNDESDGALVRRTCSGEPRAFEALVRRHEKTVFNAALRMLHDREEARDVSQTVFLKVYEHLGEYDPSHKFYSWIYRIALNESIKSLQRRKPTAALDWGSAELFLSILRKRVTGTRMAAVLVTHDPRVLEWIDHLYHLENGTLRHEPR